MRNFWIRTAVALALGVAGMAFAGVAAWRYALAEARRELELQFEAVLGEPLDIDAVELDWTHVVANRVRARGPTVDSWLTIDRVEATISLWDAIRGRTTPDQVAVHGAVVRLRIDEHGQLLTRLPDRSAATTLPYESLVFRDCSLSVLREGSAAILRATQIDGELRSQTAAVTIEATIGGALGTTWTLSGTSGETTSLTLASPRLQLVGSELAQWPWVPDAAAMIDRLSTAVEVRVDLQARTNAGPESPRIAVSLSSADASLAEGLLLLTNGSAELVAEGQELQLVSLAGDYGGGRMSLAGEIDLQTATGDLEARVEGLELTRLPSNFGIPADVRGRLAGSATLQFEAASGNVSVSGTAQGSVQEAAAAGIPIDSVDVQADFAGEPSAGGLSGQVQLDVAASQVEVQTLAKRFSGPNLGTSPVPAGRLNVHLQLTSPLARIRDPSAYQGSGQFSLPELTAGRFRLQEILSEIRIAGGRAALEEFQGRLAGGQLTGRLVGGLGAGELTAELEFQELEIAELAASLPSTLHGITGSLAGKLAARGSLETLTDIDSWSVSGELEAAEIVWRDEHLLNSAANLALDRGELRLSEIRADWSGSRITGAANLRAAAPYTFRAELAMLDVPAAIAAGKLPQTALPAIEGSGTLHGQVSGSLVPLTWRGEGAVRFDQLALADWQISGGEANWTLDQQGLAITSLQASLAGGELSASGTMPFAGQPLTLRGTFSEFECATLLRNLGESIGDTAEVDGTVSGSFTVSAPPAVDDLSAEVEFHCKGLSARSAEFSEVAGTASYAAGALQAEVAGRALAGNVQASISGFLVGRPAAQPLRGRIQATGIDLASAVALSQQSQLQPLRGRADIDVEYQVADFQPTGGGEISITQLRWHDTEIASTARAKIALRDGAIVIDHLEAQTFSGTGTGELRIPVVASGGGNFRLDLRRIRTQRLLALWPKMTEVGDGILDLRVEGRLDRRWYGSAQLQMARGNIAGVDFQRLRAPISWSFVPASGRLQLASRDASAQVGRGRFETDVRLTLGRRLDVECSGKLQSVALESLVKNVRGGNLIDGSLFGDFSLEGRNVGSVNDLRGRYQGKMLRAQVMLLPVFQELAASLGVGSLNRTFDVAEARGQIHKGGVVTVDEMNLANSDVQMSMEGRLWFNGRLDLDVTAHAGKFAGSSLLGQLARSPIGLSQPGIALVIRASELLERRLIFLRLAGTIRNPVIYPRPQELLSQEVVLFFLDEASSQLLR